MNLFCNEVSKRMNFYNHHIKGIFKSHSTSVTFKFCAVRVALCTLEPCSRDSLGTQHRTKFESNTNRMTFEYAPNMMIVKVHHLGSTMTYLLEESTASASLCYTGKLLL